MQLRQVKKVLAYTVIASYTLLSSCIASNFYRSLSQQSENEFLSEEERKEINPYVQTAYEWLQKRKDKYNRVDTLIMSSDTSRVANPWSLDISKSDSLEVRLEEKF